LAQYSRDSDKLASFRLVSPKSVLVGFWPYWLVSPESSRQNPAIVPKVARLGLTIFYTTCESNMNTTQNYKVRV
jgi:hypothetical protein